MGGNCPRSAIVRRAIVRELLSGGQWSGGLLSCSHLEYILIILSNLFWNTIIAHISLNFFLYDTLYVYKSYYFLFYHFETQLKLLYEPLLLPQKKAIKWSVVIKYTRYKYNTCYIMCIQYRNHTFVRPFWNSYSDI